MKISELPAPIRKLAEKRRAEQNWTSKKGLFVTNAFDWEKTEEGIDFWTSISCGDFTPFYKMYKESKPVTKTSKEAYIDSKPKLKKHAQKILKYINNSPMTAKEVYKAMFMDINTKEIYTRLEAFELGEKFNSTSISRRMKELVVDGFIEVRETRKCAVSGRNCLTYKLVS